jgi:hypothetical protein
MEQESLEYLQTLEALLLSADQPVTITDYIRPSIYRK